MPAEKCQTLDSVVQHRCWTHVNLYCTQYCTHVNVCINPVNLFVLTSMMWSKGQRNGCLVTVFSRMPLCGNHMRSKWHHIVGRTCNNRFVFHLIALLKMMTQQHHDSMISTKSNCDRKKRKQRDEVATRVLTRVRLSMVAMASAWRKFLS